MTWTGDWPRGLAVMSDELIRMKWAVGILSTIMHDGLGVGSELLVTGLSMLGWLYLRWLCASFGERWLMTVGLTSGVSCYERRIDLHEGELSEFYRQLCMMAWVLVLSCWFCTYGLWLRGWVCWGAVLEMIMLEPRRTWVDDRRADLWQGRGDVLLKLLWLSKKLIDSKNTLW